MGVRFFPFFLLGILLWGCAQVRPLEGGEKDERAPVPNLSKASPALGSTNIRPSTIRIPFDEYVKINNPTKNISVVPELPTKPKYEVKGRDLIITINPSELLDNTTYSFVFNQAISDLNEANDTTFTYVFSTGQFIDSLSHNVLLIDAENLSPVSNAIVGLYTPSDTLDPYTQKPRYLAQTNKLGEANFQYLGQQDFVVFAYDLKGSAKLTNDAPIAFRNELLSLDTLPKTDTLFMFVPKSPPKTGRVLSKSIDGPGRIAVRTNYDFSPAEVIIQSGSEMMGFMVEETTQSDSAVFWVSVAENMNYDVFIPFQDTVLNAKVATRKIVEKKSAVTNNLVKEELGFSDTLMLTFDFPISTFNPQSFTITQNGEVLADVSFVVENHRNLKILGNFDPDVVYQLAVLPNAVGFYHETYYADSILLSFKRLGLNKYANLELVLEDKPEVSMVIHLLSNGKVVAQQSVSAHQESVFFELLQPGEYTVKVILDTNENGQWDTGSWLLKQQAEKVIWFRQPFTLRANWDTKQPLGFQ
jgi:hypothetical protein